MNDELDEERDPWYDGQEGMYEQDSKELREALLDLSAWLATMALEYCRGPSREAFSYCYSKASESLTRVQGCVDRMPVRASDGTTVWTELEPAVTDEAGRRHDEVGGRTQGGAGERGGGQERDSVRNPPTPTRRDDGVAHYARYATAYEAAQAQQALQERKRLADLRRQPPRKAAPRRSKR